MTILKVLATKIHSSTLYHYHHRFTTMGNEVDLDFEGWDEQSVKDQIKDFRTTINKAKQGGYNLQFSSDKQIISEQDAIQLLNQAEVDFMKQLDNTKGKGPRQS